MVKLFNEKFKAEKAFILFNKFNGGWLCQIWILNATMQKQEASKVRIS